MKANLAHLCLVSVPMSMLPAGHVYDTIDGEYGAFRSEGQTTEFSWA